ncbi:MAG TPA: dienelactone hydrolase family protein [Sphingomonas sp.]
MILLHGYGSNGDDLIALAPMLQSILPDAAFVAPNAPTRCPGTAGGFQWWPIQSFSMQERSAGAIAAAPELDAFISSELAEHGLAEDRLLLIGFSQGTMMALHVGVRRPNPVAGIIGFSGMLVAPDLLESEAESRPPILLIHGDADPVVPFRSLAEAKRTLEAAGFSVAQHVSPGLGHNVDPAGIAAAADFARKVLPA